MSAILETEPGNELVCIGRFSAPPRVATPRRKGRRSFRIGERVRYIGYYQDERIKDNPAGWMVVFEPLDAKNGNTYAATHTYFSTLETWEALKKYFAKGLMMEPQRLHRVGTTSEETTTVSATA